MSDLFDDVRRDLPDWYQSDLERVVDSPFSVVLSKNLSNFDAFHRDYSHRYNKVLKDEVKILPNEDKYQALDNIKDSFADELNKTGGFLDIAKNNIKKFDDNLRDFFYDEKEGITSKLPETDDLTESLHIPKILLRDNKSLDSVSYKIDTIAGTTRILREVKLTFKSQDNDHLKCELKIAGPYSDLDLPMRLLQLPDPKLAQSVLNTLQKPKFFDTIENLIQNDAIDRAGKFDKMKTNFELIKQGLNYLDNNEYARLNLDKRQPLAGVHIPRASLVHMASLVYLEDLGKCAISLPPGHERVYDDKGRAASTKVDKNEVFITADSKWSDFLATNSVNSYFHLTDNPLEIQASHKIFLMHLLKNDDLINNLKYYIDNEFDTIGYKTLHEEKNKVVDYFDLQSRLNQPKENFLPSEDRSQYKEDLKKLQSLEKSLKYAKEKVMEWDKKIDINQNNLISALNEIKSEYAKLGIDIDVEIQNLIK